MLFLLLLLLFCYTPIPIRPTSFPILQQQPECLPSTSAIIPSDLSLNKPHAFSHTNSLTNLRIPVSATTIQQQQQPIVSTGGELSPESKSTREMVQLQLAFIERGTEPRPYVITIQDNDLPPIVDNDVNAAINRKMLKTITHYSRVCQTRPHFKIVGPQESQFALYSQNVASEEHVAQLFQYLACYSTKPKINEKDFCKYTIASGASIVAHPTHSSTIPAMIPQALIPNLQKPKVELIIPKSEPPSMKHVQFSQHESEPIASSSKVIVPTAVVVTTIKAETPIRYANNTDELIARKQSLPGAEYAAVAAKIKPISGGGRSEEVEVYVRGRGRGRYVCDRCGIKCKKPSMLKKHLKSHTNIRPFNCFTCNFSFKTKGNLTKHLFSKTHRRKLEETKNDNNEDGTGGLQIVDDDDDENAITAENREDIEKRIRMESIFVNDHNDADDEDEEDYVQVLPDSMSGNNDITYRSFGQENIIYERDTHTPPTWWTLCKNGEEQETWSKPDLRRSCHSAPPMLEAEIAQKLTAAASGITVPVYNQALPQTEPNIGLIALQQIKRDGNVSKFAESVSRGDNEAQMQLTSEVIRMTKGTDGGMLPIVRTQEILKPLARKRTYTGTCVDQPVLSTFMSKDNFNCDQCSRKFRKESELNLHRQTHLIEKQQNAKSKSCQCPECKIQLRSKTLLQKHMETAHGDIEMSSSFTSDEPPPAIASSSTSSTSTVAHILSNGSTSTLINGMASSIIGASLPSNATTLPMTRSLSISNGRSFICVDCSLGFRSHGVLAKHLRTKNHVRQLCSLGKLPEDAMSLIRDNSSALAGVDASDCDTARISLIGIINRLRQANGGTLTTTTSNNEILNLDLSTTTPSKPSLECNEQLSSVSPTPRIPDSNFRERGSSLSTIPRNKNKRNNFDEFSTSAQTTPRKQSRIISSSSARSPTISPTFYGSGITPPIGITNKATATTTKLSQSDINNLLTYSISDVWVPPKAEDIDIGTRFINPILQLQLIESPTTSGFNQQPSTSNNTGFDETTSDATSRSETSTPQQKHSICIVNNNNNNNNNNATATTPIIQSTILNSTKCQICDSTFDSPNELQIHFQSEHISIRDGSYFGCPNSSCEKVYPSKESLKKHLLMHYRPGSFIAPPPSFNNNNDQDEFAPPTNSSAISPSDLLNNGGAISPPGGMNRKSSKTAHTAPKRSPGAPEETHTISGIGIKPEQNSIIGIKNERLILKCNQCNLEFNDANDLQTHYVTHFSRPHVCPICDAGFTTFEALQSHSMAHLGIAQAQA
uniref:C2H2-type domain-containing protein n=1 Tax=Panagrolaimus sp. PS1159 TaxID=55785 RepID=A0AC35FVR0_9BILA